MIVRNFITATTILLLCNLSGVLHAQSVLNFANETNQVQLLISVNTNSCSLGSTMTVSFSVTNASTNVLVSVDEFPVSNASFFYIDELKNAHEILPPRDLDVSAFFKNFYHPGSYSSIPG